MTHSTCFRRQFCVLLALIVAQSVMAQPCVRLAPPLAKFRDVSMSEDVRVLADGTVLVARGPDGLAAFSPEGRLRSVVRFDARSLSVSGTTAWLLGDSGLHAIDVSNPDALRVIANFSNHPWITFSRPSAIVAEGSRLFLAWSAWAEVFDVTDPSAPVQLAVFRTELASAGLRKIGELLVFDVNGELTIWNVRDLTVPTKVGSVRGRLFDDERGQWYLQQDQTFSRVVFHGDRVPSVEELGTLKSGEYVVAIAGDRLFVRHDRQSLAVLTLPALEFVGGIGGNFETGSGPIARNAGTLYLSTRFGGLQSLAPFAIADQVPEVRSLPLTRLPYYGDVVRVVVMPGDSVARLLAKFDLNEPSPSWEARMVPLNALNLGNHPEFPLLHVGDQISLPLPRTLLCRP